MLAGEAVLWGPIVDKATIEEALGCSTALREQRGRYRMSSCRSGFRLIVKSTLVSPDNDFSRSTMSSWHTPFLPPGHYGFYQKCGERSFGEVTNQERCPRSVGFIPLRTWTAEHRLGLRAALHNSQSDGLTYVAIRSAE